MTACGKRNQNLLSYGGKVSVYDCLSEFSVGTDLSKASRSFKARANPKNYCLIRNFLYSDPLHAAAKIINKEIEEKNDDTTSPYEINISEGPAKILSD